MSQVAAKKVVSIDYVLTDAGGEEIDRSEPGHPMAYLHGSGNIVPGLERQLEGLEVGASITAIVPAAEGYGPRRGYKDVQLMRSQFPGDVQLGVGMQFYGQDEKGQPVPMWIRKVQGKQITATAEHPLAGVDLHFQCTIVEIRDASEEEVQHGHAHGPHGHGH